MSTTCDLERPIGECKFPKHFIKLQYSNHAQARLKERTSGSLILAPHYIRLNRDNTVDLIMNGNRVVGATVVIEYKKGVYMYLPMIVSSGIVKTVYFKNVKKDKTTGYKKRIEDKGIIVEDVKAIIPEFQVESKTGNTDRQTETIRGITQDVEDVSRDLGREKESRWKALLRVIRGIFR